MTHCYRSVHPVDNSNWAQLEAVRQNVSLHSNRKLRNGTGRKFPDADSSVQCVCLWLCQLYDAVKLHLS